MVSAGHGVRPLTLAVAGVALAALAALYYFVDPAESAFMPRCWFRYLTGLDCPGCGSQRMLHALLHGDIATAWRANALLLLLSPLLVFMLWLETQRLRRPRLYARFYSVTTTAVFVVVLVGWGVFRNVFTLF